MASVKMMQGDSYAVFVSLTMEQTGDPITPSMVSDIEICVGDSLLRKTYASGEVMYDATQSLWYFVPTQEDTLGMEPDSYEAQARVKFLNGQYPTVKGITVGTIMILDAKSEEVI